MSTAPAAAVRAPMPAAPSPPAGAVTRDQILAVARTGSPWAFLPLGLAALRQRPDDPEMRFLVAAGFARLMLVTPAREHLAALPAAAHASEAVKALSAAVAALPTDRLSIDSLAATCAANLHALASKPGEQTDLAAHLPAWKAHAAAWSWFRARDGQVVRRPSERAGGRGPEHDAWHRLQDVRGQVAGLTLPHESGGLRPYVLEGMDPPWLVERILRETPVGADGHQPRVTIVQEDALEFLDGLAQVDLSELLRAERVRVIAGPGAAERLADVLSESLGTQIVGPGLSMSTVRTKITPSLEVILQGAQHQQITEQGQLLARVKALYAQRDRAWWAWRFGEAHRSTSRPLRVLIPTCRYSTYIRHASADLAAALVRIGCESRVLIEPDNHSHLSSLAYLREFAGFEPDLVVMINYSRANLNGEIGAAGPSPGVIPRGVPYVMWVQDAMPHQLDARVGAAMGELDFVAGNVRSELFWRFGYPRGRSLDAPIVASGEKFHTGPIDDALRERHTCEIAYVSHHAETPEAMHDRKCAEASDNAALVSLVQRLRPAIERECGAVSSEPLSMRLRRAAQAALRENGGAADDPRLVEQLMQLYAMPMADRLLRHQTLEWASAIAAERGWRMHLYGRGWEKHPTLAAHARGELTHGEDLRACYQSAAAHLQVSAHSVIHQRIFECVLSGGLPIARLTEDDLSTLEFSAAIAAARAAQARGEPHDASDPWRLVPPTYRYFGYRAAGCAEAQRYIALRRRLGLVTDGEEPLVWVNSVHIERMRAGSAHDGIPLATIPEERSLMWLLDEPESSLFVDRQGLEAALERAVGDDAWRRRTIERTRARVEQRLTHQAFARRLIGFVRDGLSGPATPTENNG